MELKELDYVRYEDYIALISTQSIFESIADCNLQSYYFYVHKQPLSNIGLLLLLPIRPWQPTIFTE